MVFFTCNACGESLKKGQVEKHTLICRNCQCLSCIDCGKDFWGEDYKNHLKCISEDQKYGGKGFEAKTNKGDVKQQQWIQRIHEVMKKPSITAHMKSILSQISTYDNIPRKKAKFQNWMKNSLKIHNQALQDQVWEIFSEATSTQKETSSNGTVKPSETTASESQGAPESSETAEETDRKKNKRERKEERQKKNKKEKKELNNEEQVEPTSKKKGKKRKKEETAEEVTENEAREEEATEKKKKKKNHGKESEDMKDDMNEKQTVRKKRKHSEIEEPQEDEVKEHSADENGEENCAKRGKFNWKGTIKALLKDAPDNEIPIKKLRKKVLAQYYTVSSIQHKSEEELLATFNKKVRNNPKFRVLKERVKLLK